MKNKFTTKILHLLLLTIFTYFSASYTVTLWNIFKSEMNLGPFQIISSIIISVGINIGFLLPLFKLNKFYKYIAGILLIPALVMITFAMTLISSYLTTGIISGSIGLVSYYVLITNKRG